MARFVSAYAEFEYRVSPEFEANFPSTCAQGDWVTNTFDLLDAGDREMVSKRAPGESENAEGSSESATTTAREGGYKPLDSDALWSPDSPVWPRSGARRARACCVFSRPCVVDDSREARAAGRGERPGARETR